MAKKDVLCLEYLVLEDAMKHKNGARPAIAELLSFLTNRLMKKDTLEIRRAISCADKAWELLNYHKRQINGIRKT
ncbi:hypothetical protein A2188_00800 [Candidatus Woesebacteria bacterium RIFOXYA1_FULL_43_9]|uniref:Uncharacterized protein n=1 Tax=Candidatus Woesebacteria bacterium RIFOXYA1_FULL_43_9 TaxID=1802534 RepID=A0A1F8CL75_9BACT|nr:MAG: hypothetical protein A2188_00800 [Candidatus Woesebacteria bacterium RIFOXYA1_FULL_43_9]